MTPAPSLSAPLLRRGELDALLERGDRAGARKAARQLWDNSPDAATARFLKQRREALHDTPPREWRVAILRSCTVEPVIPLLEAEAALANVRLSAWVGAFNAYVQDALAPGGGLYAFAPDTILLGAFARDLAPALWDGFADLSPAEVDAEIDAASGLLRDVLGQLRARSPAAILCQGLDTPAWSAGGVQHIGAGRSQAEAFEEINRRLRQACAAQTGTYFMDYDALVARHGRAAWTDERKWAAVRLPFSAGAMRHAAAEWWRHLAVLALPPAKVLALDLDNTLWGGILGEDGLAGLELGNGVPGVFYARFQRAILDVARRGVLLVAVSKNNEADALEVLDQHPDMIIRRHHLAAWRIDWEQKATNLEALANDLGLSLDSFVFLDDNPAECDAVRRALPEVEVIELPEDPAELEAVVRRHPRLERFSLTAEDRQRSQFYAQDRARGRQRDAAASLEDFLASLEIRVEIDAIGPATMARAAQLTQKTNQLNLTTRRYSEADLEARLRDPGVRGYVLRAADRFGEHGIVGVAITEQAGDDCLIDSLLLSCRVIGRQVERALLARLESQAREDGATWLSGVYVPTAKNTPAASLYAEAGFARAPDSVGDARTLWRLDLRRQSVTPPVWSTPPATS